MKRIKAGSGKSVVLVGGNLIELAQDNDSGWSVALTKVYANCNLTRHRHKVATEVYVGIYGEGNVHVDGDVLPLQPGDLIRIDPGEVHHATASNTDLTFLALSFPAYDPEDFRVVDEVQ